jgi:hypothetical protein
VTSTASVSTPPSGGSNGPLALSSLPTSITLAEDGSTNLNFAVSDNTAPIYTVITTASSSNSILLSTSDLWISGSGTNRVLSIRPALHVSGSTKITVIASDDRPVKFIYFDCHFQQLPADVSHRRQRHNPAGERPPHELVIHNF